MKGNVKEIAVNRVKQCLACLIISPQYIQAVIFNYRK